jgi:methyltransferase (TIGR00027 family)
LPSFRENLPHADFSLLINHSLLTENGSMSIFAQQDSTADPLCVFGVRSGYSPQIGIFVSQLNWMRRVVLSRLQSLSIDDLDWLPNPDGNSIGALLIHLAATEIYYGLNTFDVLPWGRYPYEIRMKWGVAMALGETARVRYRGFGLQYYLWHLADAREKTLSELSKRDDEWFMAVDTTWGWGPTNNLCKWFHVCEHESHHLGQIDLILKQLPSRMVGDKRSILRDQASRTALGVALRRAAHQVYDAKPLVLNDPIAVPLLGDTYAKALAEALEDVYEKPSLLMRAWLVVRSRFTEDKLATATNAGVRQYVVLGAGLDTFGLRNPYPSLEVYEVDHPATQALKRKLVGSSGWDVPESLHFVAVDFETQSLQEQLKNAGLDITVPTLFAMLGVVVYLTADAFEETLNYIAGFPEGSGVIFDYAVPRDLLPEDEVDARDELASRVESAGEPFRLFFGPEAMRKALGAFESIEDLDDKELNRRYFGNRTDQLNLRGRSGHMIAAYRGSSVL